MSNFIHPNDVLEDIRDNQPATVKKIAVRLRTSPDTVRAKIRILKNDGEHISFNKKGYWLFDKIDSADDALVMKEFTNWLIGTTKCAAQLAKNTKQLQIQAGQYIKYSLTAKERKELKGNLRFITSLVDLAEIDMQIGD